MPMRLSGLMSGMDTESIIAQMVEAKKVKVTKAIKAQKSLKYKQDAWKDLNKQILNLYNKSLNNMRFESSFIKKTTKVSNSSAVSVITGEGAMNSVQSMTVEDLAQTAYLTGGKIEASDGGKVTGNTKLSELGFTTGANGNIRINVNGENKAISVDGNSTITGFVNTLRSIGLTVNFDENNGRLHIASKASGKDQDFSITATNVAGLEALSALKLNYSEVSVSATDRERGIEAKVQDELDHYTAKRNGALAEQKDLMDLVLKYGDAIDAKLQENGSTLTVATFTNGTNTITDDQLADISDAIADVVNEAGKGSDAYKDLNSWTNRWNESAKTLKALDEDTRFEVDGSGSVSWRAGEEAKFKAEATQTVDKMIADQNALAAKLKAVEEGTADDATINEVKGLNLAHKTAGKDAHITLNGVDYYSSRNTFEVNGLTLTVSAKTGPGEVVTITTEDDTNGVYDMVKNFIKEYNALINQMDKFYNADSAKGYDPLTDEEKEAMSDSQIEEWENKIKESILRKDSTLGTFSGELKRIMMEGVEVNGTKMYLSNFGIGTLSYFSAAENERNAYHIDGDPDDDSTSGNADKLKSMIANEPDTVVSFFTQLSKNLYDKMFDMMKSKEGYSSAMTAYDDKKMQSDYDDYTTKIKELEDKLADYEDKWYAKFAAMETALAKMQNNASAVTSLLGG